MHTLTDIPFELDGDSLFHQAGIEAGSADAADFAALIQLAQDVGRPKAAYVVAFVEVRTGDDVQVDGVTFTSRTLSRNLESIDRVFPMLATCGRELDAVFPAQGDMLQEFWWDLIKTRLLMAANKQLTETLHRRFRLGKTITMRPGSGDASVWPIQQQHGLFALLGKAAGKIGVELTESCLMLPNKTTSGLLIPTEKDFKSCEVCHRKPCPSRHAPFNAELWDALQHD